MPFDPSQHGDMNDRSPIPAGDYTCYLESFERKQNSKRTGYFLSITFQVVDGEHKGRKLWSNLNLDNPNHKAVAIAESELATLCRAAGVAGLRDEWNPVELGGKTVICSVKVKDDRNEVTFYQPLANQPAPTGSIHDHAPENPASQPDDGLPF